MKTLPILQPGDSVEIIAPASRCSDSELTSLKNLLTSWQLDCIVAENIFGHDLFCANSDAVRLQHLKNALTHPTTKAIICARGGYGSMKLLPGLAELAPPKSAKLFVGMSDITALQLYLQQKWHWPTIHGALAPERFSPESIASLKSILFGETKQVEFRELIPLNHAAKQQQVINTKIVGGNLCLVQTSIGTSWQIDARENILLLEEVGERGYRIDRMLEHLQQVGIFQQARAILLGDFLQGAEPNGTSLVNDALKRFAERCDMPVVQVKNVGHGYINLPMPLGVDASLKTGHTVELVITLTK